MIGLKPRRDGGRTSTYRRAGARLRTGAIVVVGSGRGEGFAAYVEAAAKEPGALWKDHVLSGSSPEREARELYACNAHSPDGQNVIIQRGCTDTGAALGEAGFNVIEIDTDEFLKAGGSVFCMKLMTW